MNDFKKCKRFLLEVKQDYKTLYSCTVNCWNDKELKQHIAHLKDFETYNITADKTSCTINCTELKQTKIIQL